MIADQPADTVASRLLLGIACLQPSADLVEPQAACAGSVGLSDLCPLLECICRRHAHCQVLERDRKQASSRQF